MRNASHTKARDEEESQGPAQAMRITDQFRQQGSMMYDLKGGEALRLTLRIGPSNDAWEIEAVAKQAPALPPITVRGPTRRDALSALVAAWVERTELPPVDWTSVRTALEAVRAL